MSAASALDYRALARRRLPHFLFVYIDGGSCAETTLRRNVSVLGALALRQRVLTNVADLKLPPDSCGRRQSLPVARGDGGYRLPSRRRYRPLAPGAGAMTSTTHLARRG